MEFTVGDHAFVKVSPVKIIRFRRRGKLSPRFIDPFQILGLVGNVVYRLTLPPHFFDIRNIFHVSMLQKYHCNPAHVISYESLALQFDCHTRNIQFVSSTNRKEYCDRKIFL